MECECKKDDLVVAERMSFLWFSKPYKRLFYGCSYIEWCYYVSVICRDAELVRESQFLHWRFAMWFFLFWLISSYRYADAY